jgi:Fe-S oxidoreductase
MPTTYTYADLCLVYSENNEIEQQRELFKENFGFTNISVEGITSETLMRPEVAEFGHSCATT